MLPTPIKTAAIDFSQSHVAVFPCLGDDGKLPLVTWGHLKRPPKPETIDKWWAKWPDANVGIATEPSRLTVVDCDDASVVKTMLRECGDTPLISGRRYRILSSLEHCGKASGQVPGLLRLWP